MPHVAPNLLALDQRAVEIKDDPVFEVRYEGLRNRTWTGFPLSTLSSRTIVQGCSGMGCGLGVAIASFGNSISGSTEISVFCPVSSHLYT